MIDNHCRMQSDRKFRIVFVTSPDLKTARTLAKAALKSRLIACANLVPKIESHYRWKDKIESADEVLMILKTTRANLPMLERLIRATHPYETPEFLVLTVDGGEKDYLEWLADCCAKL